MAPAEVHTKSATAKKNKKEDAEPVTLTGVFMFPNGDKYEGEYVQGDDGIERNGTGTLSASNGICYQGNWSSDKMNGKGRIAFPTGAVYEGEFVNNKFHGRGCYTWPNGSFYDGEFVENKLEGGGEFSDTEGQFWTGTFRYKAAPGLRFKLDL